MRIAVITSGVHHQAGPAKVTAALVERLCEDHQVSVFSHTIEGIDLSKIKHYKVPAVTRPKIPWAIYAGVAAVLGFLTPAFRLILYSQHRLSTSKKVAEDLLILLLIIPLLFFTGIVMALQALTAWLATRDRLKKLLIAFGSVMLLAGLILEFISTL